MPKEIKGQNSETFENEQEEQNIGPNENESENEQEEQVAEDSKEENSQEENPTLEFLRTQAKDLGLDSIKVNKADEQKLFQMITDKKAQQAVETNKKKEEKRRKEEEMKKNGEFEELLRNERKGWLQDVLETSLEAKNLTELKDYINVDNLLEEDKDEAKTKIKSLVSSISDYVTNAVDKKVKEKIAEKESGTFTNTKVNTNESNKDKSIVSKISERLNQF
jgi:hypothetical protein